MSKSAQAATGRVKAFEKQPKSSTGGSIAPLGLIAAGLLTCVLGVVTALPSPPHPIVETLAEVLGRAGLDKGPVFLAGVFLAALGLVASSAGRGGGAASDGETMDAMEVLASDVEAVSAILASVQGELSTIRSDAHELRRRSDAEAQSKQANGEGSDPMFRLAASLDQLGATIAKRVEAVRGEMLQAVQAVSERVAETQDHAEAVRAEREQAKEFEALRLDIADIGGRFKAIEEELARLGGAPADEDSAPDEDAAQPGEAQPDEAQLDAAEETQAAGAHDAHASVEPPLPRELAADPAPTFPAPAPAPQQPQPSAEDEAPAPPPPIPRPSEGLQLIDDMDEDTARASDITPPLFPDIDSGHGHA